VRSLQAVFDPALEQGGNANEVVVRRDPATGEGGARHEMGQARV
jgi:hypothetical protein